MNLHYSTAKESKCTKFLRQSAGGLLFLQYLYKRGALVASIQPDTMHPVIRAAVDDQICKAIGFDPDSSSRNTEGPLSPVEVDALPLC